MAEPSIRDPKVRVLDGKLTLRGLVYGHPEHDDGAMFETAPLTLLNIPEKMATTKAVTYSWEGELK